MQLVRALTLVCVAGVTPFAMADNPSFSYIAGSWSVTDIDDIDERFMGPSFSASAAVTDWFHVWGGGGYQTAEVGPYNVDLNTTSFSGGLGGNVSVADGVSLYGRIGYLWTEAEASSGYGSLAESVDGGGIAGGIRILTSGGTDVDVAASMTFIDGEQDGGLGVGVWQRIVEGFDIGGSFSFSDDATGVTIGLRYTF